MMVEIADPVGAYEIAERCGITRQAISHWSKRYDDFPDPRIRLRSIRVWDWQEVRVWLIQTYRLDPLTSEVRRAVLYRRSQELAEFGVRDG